MKIKFIAALLDIESLRRSYTLLSSFIFLGSILCPAQEVFRADYNFYYKRAPESRYAQRLAFYEDYSHRPGRHHFEYPLHEAYPIFNRAWSSSPYFDELTGMHTATGKYTDKMGNWIPVSPEIPHIPLIPDDYWKSSRQVFR